MAQKGILGRKLGMTQVFDDENRSCRSPSSRPGLVASCSSRRPSATATPPCSSPSATPRRRGSTSRSSATSRRRARPPQQYLAELRVDDLSDFELGQVIEADVFAAGERVDVTGITQGPAASPA